MTKTTGNTNPLDALERLAAQRGPRTKSLRRALRRLLDRLACVVEEGDAAGADGYRVRRCTMNTGKMAFELSRLASDEGNCGEWADDEGFWILVMYASDGDDLDMERKYLLGFASAARKLVERFRARLENEAVEMARATDNLTQLTQEIDELAVVRGVQLS